MVCSSMESTCSMEWWFHGRHQWKGSRGACVPKTWLLGWGRGWCTFWAAPAMWRWQAWRGSMRTGTLEGCQGSFSKHFPTSYSPWRWWHSYGISPSLTCFRLDMFSWYNVSPATVLIEKISQILNSPYDRCRKSRGKHKRTSLVPCRRTLCWPDQIVEDLKDSHLRDFDW